MDPVLISIGGAAGAVSRYLLGLIVPDRSFPWPTLAVNALGSSLLGLVLFGYTSDTLVLLVGVGFCGAFTTFSSFSFETVGLWEQDRYLIAVLNAGGNLIVSLAAFGTAWILVG